jgi:hypothetical protein
MQNLTSKSKLEQTTKRAAWYKIIEDFNNSGQSQVNYCKSNNINKDHFAYYISVWRKNNTVSQPSKSFMPLQVVNTISQDKWRLNLASGISLEVPSTLPMQQLAELILNLRAGLC